MSKSHIKEHIMKKQTFTIPNISCGHCVATIQDELQELKGVVHVSGNPEAKSVTVEWQASITASQIEAKLTEIGYPAST